MKKDGFDSHEPIINSDVREREASLCGNKGFVDRRISEMKRKSEPLFIDGTISAED
jgi:hypothetical protein